MEESQESPGFLFVWKGFCTAKRAEEKENRVHYGLCGERFSGKGGRIRKFIS